MNTFRNWIGYKFLKRIFYTLLTPQQVAARIYRVRFGKSINWNNPQDLNEKINWLKFNTDTTLWSEYSDKYKVREYIKRCGFEDILVPLYGHWYNPNDINFDKLPNSFVLKTNHGSGSLIFVKDKSKINEQEIKENLIKWLNTPFGKSEGEPHYLKIKPCVIAEEYLQVDPNNSFSLSLIDYKIWCFNGVPKYIWVCYNRTPECVYVETYDIKWNYVPEKSFFTDHYRDGKGVVPKPVNLNRMLQVASRLSQGFPQVRVDLYEHQQKLYFGELTFTSNGGYMDFYTPEFLLELGSYVKL